MNADDPVLLLLLAQLRRELPDVDWKPRGALLPAPAAMQGAVEAVRSADLRPVEVRIGPAAPDRLEVRPRWRLLTAGEVTWPSWAGRPNVGLPPSLLLRLRELLGPASLEPLMARLPACGRMASAIDWSLGRPDAAWRPGWLRGRLGRLQVQVGWDRGGLRVAASWRRGTPRAGWPSPAPTVEERCGDAPEEVGAALDRVAARALRAADAARAARILHRATAAEAAAEAAAARLAAEERRAVELERLFASQPRRVERARQRLTRAAQQAERARAGAALAALGA